MALTASERESESSGALNKIIVGSSLSDKLKKVHTEFHQSKDAPQNILSWKMSLGYFFLFCTKYSILD